MNSPATSSFYRLPLRTIILFAIPLMVASLGLEVLGEITRVLRWIVVAAFFATVLGPAVDFMVQKTGMKRGTAASIVFVLGVVVISALMYLFIRPLVDQSVQFANDFPEKVEEAKNGEGPVGGIVERYNIAEWVEENQDELRNTIEGAQDQAGTMLRSVANTLAAVLTILVLTFLMLLEGPAMLRVWLNTVDDDLKRERIRKVASDCARSVTGYMAGNLVISVIAGVCSFMALSLMGVPFPGVLALWVGFADLIPLIGATLGAIPAVFVAFLHSPTAGLIAVIFFILYQQFENHILQVTIMSRTVKLNPLLVLVSVLMGVEVLGIVGALLAIPVGGMIQVIIRDVYDHRTGGLKAVPTTGMQEMPTDPGAANGD